MIDWTVDERDAWSLRCLDLLDEIWEVAAHVPLNSDQRKIGLISDVATTIALRRAIVAVLRRTAQLPVRFEQITGHVLEADLWPVWRHSERSGSMGVGNTSANIIAHH